MEPDLSLLDALLEDEDADGYLIEDASRNSDQLYLSGFDAPDSFVTLYTDGEIDLLVSGLEYGRARSESRADHVARLSDYDYQDKAAAHGPREANHRVLREFLSDRSVDRLVVPPRFPIAVADALREQDLSLAPDLEDTVTETRATKTDDEIEHVRRAQRATEAAMKAAETLLREADAESGVLHHSEEALTSERLKEEIEITLLRRGCALEETIVACGADAADPHDRGSGPLHADEAIVIDIFPREKESKYHADMTRTFAVGEPGETIQEWYDITLEAKEAALAAIEPGVTGADVHDAVCDVYESAGLPTLRSDESTETGFIHGTGHGVGLDIHEQPRVNPSGGKLRPGHVITIEPGLYDPEVGGVRIEDLVVVREEGYENLTEYPDEFVLE